jgi:hypothetical protein
MANIINNNFNFYKLKPYRGEYWDLTLNKNMYQSAQKEFKSLYDEKIIAYFDLTDKSSFDGIFVNSLGDYKWENAYSTNYVLENVGYTGFDNGLFYFERDKIRNEEFPILYSDSKYDIKENEERLKLHFITGSTIQYSYDYEIEEDSIKLNGGFLQGFFKTECNKYEVLPSSFKHGDSISFEFILKPTEMERKRFPRMNDVHPSNKGLFFYIGTRSENKWDYLYNKYKNEIDYGEYVEDSEIDVKTYKVNSFINMEMEINEESFPSSNVKGKIESHDFFNCNCLEEDNNGNCIFDYIEDEMDISDFIYKTHDDVFTLGDYEDYVDYTNPFLLYNRTCDGFNVKTSEKDSFIRYIGIRTKVKKKDNLFILMNRTSSGQTTSTIEKYFDDENFKYDVYADIHENALGFRITDNGEIGYRYLIKNKNAINDIEMVEGYSKKNMIKNDEWNHIIVKINFIQDIMTLKFYVNSNLVFISKNLPKLNLRALDEIYEKQETVPFNISLGGGSQGLIDTILPNYMINPYRIYPIEKNFAGSFIGYIKTFKIYLGNINYDEIFNNFQYEVDKILK